jgi:flavin prenyltransferase
MRTILGITGASGIAFTLDLLKKLEGEIFVVASNWGEKLLKHEAATTLENLKNDRIKIFKDTDLEAPLASGSFNIDQMIILPCSAGTLNKIACGISDTLLTRAAMVTLKQKRKLILCLRETPLSTQTLRNACNLSEDGALIMPLMPPFYHNPLTIEAILEAFSWRVMQSAGLNAPQLWSEQNASPEHFLEL